jgi:1,2-diacylglycerol-3-alpha-glucose alpha-1,2-galactosyltransferase
VRIQVISESDFTVGGHGVHSAFVDHLQYLRCAQDTELVVNGRPDATADIVHVHTVGPYAALMLLLSSGARVITAHVTAQSLLGSIVGGRSLQSLAERYLSWFYNQADLVIAPSDYVKREIHELGVNKPTVVLPNWIPSDQIGAVETRQKIRNDLGLTDADALVVTVGQAQPRKGVLDFVACARLLPDVQFLWVGGAIFGLVSAQSTSVQREFSLAAPNVTHVGNVPRDRVYEYLSAGDIYISFSKQETFGIAVLEAAASGLPLVLSDLPVFRAIYGEAAQYGSLERCAEILLQLTNDVTARRRWAQKAQNVARNYGWEANGPDLLGIYKSLATRVSQTGIRGSRGGDL